MENVFTSKFTTDEGQLYREEMLASLQALVPELTAATLFAEHQDPTALFALAAMARLATADAELYHEQICLCADILRQRNDAGHLGQIAIDMVAYNKAHPPKMARALTVRFPHAPDRRAMELLKSGGFRWHHKRRCWYAFDTDQSRPVWEQFQTGQQEMFDTRFETQVEDFPAGQLEAA